MDVLKLGWPLRQVAGECFVKIRCRHSQGNLLIGYPFGQRFVVGGLLVTAFALMAYYAIRWVFSGPHWCLLSVGVAVGPLVFGICSLGMLFPARSVKITQERLTYGAIRLPLSEIEGLRHKPHSRVPPVAGYCSYDLFLLRGGQLVLLLSSLSIDEVRRVEIAVQTYLTEHGHTCTLG